MQPMPKWVGWGLLVLAALQLVLVALSQGRTMVMTVAAMGSLACLAAAKSHFRQWRRWQEQKAEDLRRIKAQWQREVRDGFLRQLHTLNVHPAFQKFFWWLVETGPFKPGVAGQSEFQMPEDIWNQLRLYEVSYLQYPGELRVRLVFGTHGSAERGRRVTILFNPEQEQYMVSTAPLSLGPGSSSEEWREFPASVAELPKAEAIE